MDAVRKIVSSLINQFLSNVRLVPLLKIFFAVSGRLDMYSLVASRETLQWVTNVARGTDERVAFQGLNKHIRGNLESQWYFGVDTDFGLPKRRATAASDQGEGFV